MAYAAAIPAETSFRKFLVYSGVLHLTLLIAVAVSIYVNFLGNAWSGIGGSGGESVKVNLVSSAGIPMPTPPVIRDSQTVDPTKGLYQELEKPKPPEPPTDAQKIPEFKQEKPLPPSHKSKVFEPKIPPPDNAVPYGKGGQPKIPTGYATQPGSAAAGVSVQGPGGNFASRYGWYIESVKRRIQGNWLQSTIDPSVRMARTARCTVQFTISRDGSVKDIRISQTSGNLSLDNSGLRAVMTSNPMPALPTDYSGTYVTVFFDFDLSMSQ
jgi:protein TonB